MLLLSYSPVLTARRGLSAFSSTSSKSQLVKGEKGKLIATLMIVVRVTLLSLAMLSQASAQDSVSDNPTGSAGDFNGNVTTGGRYDPMTGNAKRVISDLSVPGSNGSYPLTFTRTYNSRYYDVGWDLHAFGSANNWRHSYQWVVMESEMYGGTVIAYDVGFPDGSVITFRPRPYNPGNPNGRTSTPTAEFSNYWRGPAGTSERLEVVDNTHIYLHTNDGGLVRFDNPSSPAFASAIVDPYGAVTLLTYGSNAGTNNNLCLLGVAEPGGRTLTLVYKRISATWTRTPGHTGTAIWTVLSQVVSNNALQAGNRQTVTYGYSTPD